MHSFCAWLINKRLAKSVSLFQMQIFNKQLKSLNMWKYDPGLLFFYFIFYLILILFSGLKIFHRNILDT